MAVGIICIYHYSDVWADRLSDNAHPLDVFVDWHCANLNFYGGAELHVLLHLLGQLVKALAFLVVTTSDVGIDRIVETAEKLIEWHVSELGF